MSHKQVELIRAVNTGTVEAVRSMRPCLVPLLSENEVTEILNNALVSLGFELFFNIVLFEEHVGDSLPMLLSLLQKHPVLHVCGRDSADGSRGRFHMVALSLAISAPLTTR